MRVDDFIETNKEQLIQRWQELAVERLALNLEESQLLNGLPQFIEDLIAALRDPSDHWPALESAQGHGRHRMQVGIDAGALTEEMALVTETILELAAQQGRQLSCQELQHLTRIVGRATAASVNAYAAMRDQDLARQAGLHFSFIAHEIRNPLQNAQLATALLSQARPEDRDKHLQRLERALHRLSDLVDNSLVGAQLSAEPRVNTELLEARALIDAAWDDVTDQAEARSLSVSTEAEDFQLEGDYKVLVSALANLLKNAVKFTAEGGRITVRARSDQGRALFEIEDQCGGMPKELPPRLFQPFTQANADRRGFGLGLVIVKQAAEAHHGSVRVLNHPGHGCAFVMDLPQRQ